MRFLPVFLDLQAGPVLLVGAGELARAKLRVLAAAGARIRWYATDGHHDLAGLGPVEAARVERAAGDPLTAALDGVIAILCAGAGDIGVAMSVRAKAVGLPVNVMDDLVYSTFILPAIVDRGDVVVAIGTGGTSPVVARRVRERIEALLPARIGDLAGFIGRFRKSFAARLPEMALRRRFWERVIDGPIGALVLAGREPEAEAALAAIDDPVAFAGARKGQVKGHVTLVGAGPGDPDLLTIKALRALQDADVVFYDELVSAEILDRVRRDASRVPVGRRVGQPGIGQDAINTLLIEAAGQGQRVVRLKGGDALVFGRGGEELDALREAGIACSVVPGITAGLGAAAQFEVPLTYRREALRVTFLTAHKAEDAGHIDWSTLTDSKMTVVVYMGNDRRARGARRVAGGRPLAADPGRRVREGDATGRAIRGRHAGSIAWAGRQHRLRAAILIIGDVVAHSAPWRQSHPSHTILQLLEPAE